MRLDDGQIEVIDDDMARVYRAMTGAQRLEVMEKLVRFSRELIAAKVREQHPDWTESQIKVETARRFLHGGQ